MKSMETLRIPHFQMPQRRKCAIIKNGHYRIRFPPTIPHSLDQDEAYFYLEEDDGIKRLRLHDYHELYQREGLYEQVFYERLRCRSPQKVAEVLRKTLSSHADQLSELRVLDLGAGNGVMGEILADMGRARMVGVDILDSASMACERDRPGLYDAYYVADLAELANAVRDELAQWRFTCLTCVAALGFGDIPPTVFAEAYNLVQSDGWIVFNIKETFLRDSDRTGFAALIRTLFFSTSLEIHHVERYCHRLSIDGSPLFYYAIAGKKKDDIPVISTGNG